MRKSRFQVFGGGIPESFKHVLYCPFIVWTLANGGIPK